MTLGNDARDIPLPRWVLTGIMPIAFVLAGAAARAGRAPGALAARQGRRRAMTAGFLVLALFVLLFLRVPIAISLGLVDAS